MSTFTYDHIHIRSRDPEKTAAYYERMFDAEIIRTMQDGKPRIDMKIGGQDVFIAPVPAKQQRQSAAGHALSGARSFRPARQQHRQGRGRPQGQGRRVHHGAELAAAGHEDLLRARAGRRLDRSAGTQGGMMESRLLALALLLALCAPAAAANIRTSRCG